MKYDWYNDRKYFCPLPFQHVSIQPDNSLRPCCAFDAGLSTDVDNYDSALNHPELVAIRQKIINDEPVAGCGTCYRHESQNIFSMRQDMLDNFGKNKFGLNYENSIEDMKPLLYNIEVCISNLCNIKCRMCSPEFSTKWNSDARALGIPVPEKTYTDNFDNLINSDLSSIRHIKFLGGEPLLEQDKMIELISKCNLDDLDLLIITNGTQRFNDELLSLLTKVRKLSVQLSIDCYGKLNNFVRSGSEWDNVVSNVDWFVDIKNTRLKQLELSMASVISVYNSNRLHEIINFSLQRNLYHNFVVSSMEGGYWMSPFLLPEEVKQPLLEYCDRQLENPAYKPWHIRGLDMLRDSLLENKSDWFSHFVRRDTQLNNLRNEHWKEHNIELWNLIEKEYENINQWK